MYVELYLDVLFLENFLLDYLLLRLLAKLLGCTTTRLRLFLAAAGGSIGICILYALSLENTWAGSIFIYVILGTVMVKTGLHIKDCLLLLRGVSLLYLCSFVLGGAFGWLSRNLRLPVYPFLGFSLVSYGILSFGMRQFQRMRSRRQHIYEVTLRYGENTLKLRGLLDTGNHLRDPVFGKPVSVITEEGQKELCGEAEILFHPIPFHSVGRARGMMPVFFADFLCVHRTDGGVKVIRRPLLGVTKEPLSSRNEYDMILNPEHLEEENKIC